MPSLLARLRNAVQAHIFLGGHTRRTAAGNSQTNVNRRQKVFSVHGPEHAALQSICSDGNDGAWWCDHCGQQNPLKLQEGEHAFGRLECARCRHIFTARDVSTGILFQETMRDNRSLHLAVVPVGKSCGVLCPDCGQTHRGLELRGKAVPGYTTFDFSVVRCSCGRRDGGTCQPSWYRFSIGSCRDWHLDRVRAEGQAMEERMERRFQQHRDA